MSTASYNAAVQIRYALKNDMANVAAVLTEASEWLCERGMPMWKGDELLPERITQDVVCGLFAVAVVAGEIVGTMKFQLEDELFWPDLPRGEAAYVHRLAVKRAFAGGTISYDLLAWAVNRARELGRHYLRLDTEASRPKLRAVYERFGFQHHSDRQVGSYFVARYQLDLNRALADLITGFTHHELDIRARQGVLDLVAKFKAAGAYTERSPDDIK